MNAWAERWDAEQAQGPRPMRRAARRLFRAYRRAGGLCSMRTWAASEAGDWPGWTWEREATAAWCRRKGLEPLPF